MANYATGVPSKFDDQTLFLDANAVEAVVTTNLVVLT